MKTKLIIFVLLMVGTCLAGDIDMCEIKYKTFEGLKAQAQKVLDKTTMVIGPDTCEYITNDVKFRQWHIALHGDNIIGVREKYRGGTLVQYECWDTTYFHRQPIDLEIVREPEYIPEHSVTRGCTTSVIFGHDEYGLAVLMYREVGDAD
jgi:hypothetical protein